jgi:hypothetical protein
MSDCHSACEQVAVQGPGDRGHRRLLPRRRRQAGRHEQQPLRVLGPAHADPRAKHAGPVARTCGRRTRRHVSAAQPPEGVGDGHGAGRRRLLRFSDVVPGEQALRQGAAEGRRLRRAAGPRPLPLQQWHGARALYTTLSSQNPGLVLIGDALFGSGLPSDLLAKTFLTDTETVDRIGVKFRPRLERDAATRVCFRTLTRNFIVLAAIIICTNCEIRISL